MPHRTRIKFLLQEIGEYVVKFTWNRILLPHSPVFAVATVTTADADTQHSKSRASSISSTGSAGDQKVVLTGNGLAKAAKGVEAEFTIDGSRAGPGTLLLLFRLSQLFLWSTVPFTIQMDCRKLFRLQFKNSIHYYFHPLRMTIVVNLIQCKWLKTCY